MVSDSDKKVIAYLYFWEKERRYDIYTRKKNNAENSKRHGFLQIS